MAFDAVGGAGTHTATGTSLSWTHTAAPNSTIFIFLGWDGSITNPSVTVGGQAATQRFFDIGGRITAVFRYRSASGGALTIAPSWTGTATAVGDSVSYTSIDETTPDDGVGAQFETDGALGDPFAVPQDSQWDGTVASETGDTVLGFVHQNNPAAGYPALGGAGTGRLFINTAALGIRVAEYAGAASVQTGFSVDGFNDYLVGGFNLNAAAGSPTATVTNAGDESFYNGETGIAIAGTNFGASQGTGKVYISPTDNIADAGKVEQTVTAWGDTEITITAVRGALSLATNYYLFVDPDTNNPNTSGYVVQFEAAPASEPWADAPGVQRRSSVRIGSLP